MKKYIALLLALVMVLSMAACGGAPATPDTPSTPATPDAPATPDTPATPEAPAAGPQLSADGRYPAETVKIGFETFTTTDEQFLRRIVRDYQYYAIEEI